MPDDLRDEWVEFFLLLFDLEDLEFDRALTPPEETEGSPWLIMFSDGALVSFGCCGYIRWRLKKGGFWCRLIMSRGKIAPKCRATIPRMELSVRLEKFIVEKMKLNFEKIIHLMDSSTILGYLHKDNGSFKPYEGVRISEIQSSSQYINGRLQNWAWISGPQNVADLTTKPVKPEEIGANKDWQKGSGFLYTEFGNWPIKASFSTDILEGEQVVVHVTDVKLRCCDEPDCEWNKRLDDMLLNCSKLQTLLQATVLIHRVMKGQCDGEKIEFNSL